MLTRARIAGLFGMVMSLTQGAIAMAAGNEVVHAWLESIASGVIFIGGAVLVLIRDPRCQPKIDRANDILLKALAKDLHVEDDDHGPR